MTLATGKIVRSWPFFSVPYPKRWEDEYKKTGFVNQWRLDYEEMFKDYKGRTGKELGTLKLLPQYALMYLLRKHESIHSITWYKIANVSPHSVNRERTLRYWAIMKKWMGKKDFLRLQRHLVKRGFKTIAGEPDLFCWNPKNGHWFFAEAKGKDQVLDSQKKWYEACRHILPQVEIRCYQLVWDKGK